VGTTDRYLFRSVRKDDFPQGVIVDDHAVTGVLYPSFENKQFVNHVGATMTRPADLYPYTYEGQNVVDPGGGTSLFDRSEVFGTKYWWYFTLPQGTVVPDSLRIRHTGRNDKYDAEHYQIEAAAYRMRVDAFKGALDNLARNAVAKLYESSR
jgi:Tse2-like ADP-ribosyltransferase toxin